MQITALRRAFAAGLVAISAFAVQPAVAEEITFVMKNDHPNALRVELYSQDRDHVWPGGDQDYYLSDGEVKTMPLECNQGENICYGAWIDGDQNTYWGVGPGNKQDCETCCFTCEGGETEQITLVP